MKNKKLKVACPKCKKKFLYYESKFRPFCSERCKMVDLGKWLNEEYSVKSQDLDDDYKEWNDED